MKDLLQLGAVVMYFAHSQTVGELTLKMLVNDEKKTRFHLVV